MGTRLLVLLLSMPLAAAGAAGGLLHVCQTMGGLVVGDCDCETQADDGAHAGHQESGAHAAHEANVKLQAQPCCSIEISDAGELLATQEASTQQVEEASVALVSRTNGDLVASQRVCDFDLLRERAPPNIHGPPLFVRHCSFLN